MRHFTVYVKKGKSVSELGKFSSRSGTPGSVAKKGTTSACKKTKGRTCNRMILVREHGNNTVRQYRGSVRKLAKPEKVKIAGRIVTFKKKTSAKYVKSMKV